MRHWKKLFLFPIRLLLRQISRPFSSKYWTIYTNSKLHKIGYIADYLCSFCKRESETMQHLFLDCSYSISFWKDFEFYYLSLTKQQIHLNLKDILIGLLTPELPLLNYLLLIGKIYLWAFIRNKELIFQVYEVLNQKSN